MHFLELTLTFKLRQIIILEQLTDKQREVVPKHTNVSFFRFLINILQFSYNQHQLQDSQCGFPPFFLFPRTPSPLMIHDNHPPTCKANPALTSLYAPLRYSRGFEMHIRNAPNIEKTHEVEQIPSLALTHISVTPLLHLPVVDTGVDFSSR